MVQEKTCKFINDELEIFSDECDYFDDSDEEAYEKTDKG